MENSRTWTSKKNKLMLEPSLKKNDSRARLLIWVFSFVVFAAVVILGRVKLDVDPGFNVHVFATANALINSAIAVLLILALVFVKQKKYVLHKKVMMTALMLSVVFLVSYIAHHLLAGDTRYGGEGSMRTFYYIILISHIFLAAIILPFILFTAYRGLTGEYVLHKKIAKITWPIWFYVAVTGPLVYSMISPYYE
jgi:putative membrane protein